MTTPKPLDGAMKSGAMLLGTLPGFLTLGISSALFSTDQWYTLYPFVSLAIIATIAAIYYLPLVWRLNHGLYGSRSGERSAAESAGRRQMINVVVFSLLTGLLCSSLFWPSDSGWWLGFLTATSGYSLATQVSKLAETWRSHPREFSEGQ